METQKAIEHLKGILPNAMTRLETREAIEVVLTELRTVSAERDALSRDYNGLAKHHNQKCACLEIY